MNLINKGQYGEVYRVNTIAIKKMSINSASDWLIELILTRTIKCNRIMTARTISVTENEVSIYMDCADSDLWTWRARRRDISQETMRKLLGDIGIGLAYLHYCGVLHGDIKPSNILVFNSNNDIRCKITDFGYSSLVTTPRTIKYGTSMYSPPECLINIDTDLSADIWAYGLVVSFMILNKLPWRVDRSILLSRNRMWFYLAAYQWALRTNQQWPYITPDKVLDNCGQYEVEIDGSDYCGSILYELMYNCLCVTKENRMSAIEICEILASDYNIGVKLHMPEMKCRCCRCNFDNEHAHKIEELLLGYKIDIRDDVHTLVQGAMSIEFMPTIQCTRSRVY